jgi:hypothetical protein
LEIFRWKKVTLNNKITVLGFGGSSILENRGNLLILIKIYQRYHTFKDVQFVMICPVGTESDINSIFNARGVHRFSTMAFFVCHAARD